jgi:hypothetical protein
LIKSTIELVELLGEDKNKKELTSNPVGSLIDKPLSDETN